MIRRLKIAATLSMWMGMLIFGLFTFPFWLVVWIVSGFNIWANAIDNLVEATPFD